MCVDVCVCIWVRVKSEEMKEKSEKKTDIVGVEGGGISSFKSRALSLFGRV